MQPGVEEIHEYKLTTKNLFNHFLLVHDFLNRFTKTPATNPHYLDAQIDVKDMMMSATQSGGRFGQVFTFAALAAYCLKSNRIGMKLALGFLYMYWINHFYTLGTYCGAILKMPKAYDRVAQYCNIAKEPHPNILDKL